LGFSVSFPFSIVLAIPTRIKIHPLDSPGANFCGKFGMFPKKSSSRLVDFSFSTVRDDKKFINQVILSGLYP